MILDETIRLVRACMSDMNARYGGVVFDEWAIVSLPQQQARVISYSGSRNDVFLKNFVDDLGALRTELLNAKYAPGDFEFARHGTGTKYEAFMVLGEGLYLVCNNTTNTMVEIAQNPRWLNAQIPFAELGEKIRSSPLVYRA